jgi:hypothetical protein
LAFAAARFFVATAFTFERAFDVDFFFARETFFALFAMRGPISPGPHPGETRR